MMKHTFGVVRAAVWLVLFFTMIWMFGLLATGQYGELSGDMFSVVSMGEAFSFRDTGEYTITSYDNTFASGSVDSVSIEYGSGVLNVVPSDNDTVRIVERWTSEPQDSETVEVVLSGSSLNIQGGRRNSEMIIFGFSTNRRMLDVYLPAKDYASFRAETTSGSQNLRDVSASDMFIRSSSGSVRAFNMSANTLQLRQTSGSSELSGVFGDASVKITSGSHKMNGVIVSENLTAEMSSGSIKGNDVIVKDTFTLKASSGSGVFTEVTCGKLDVGISSGSMSVSGNMEQLSMSTTSGSLKVIDGIAPDTLYAKTTSGGVTLTIPDNSGFTLKHEKVSGSIKNAFGSSVYGDGSRDFSAKVTSGSFRLNKS